MGLVRLGNRSPGLLEQLATHPASPGRLGILLAMRRAVDPAIVRFLNDDDGQLVTEAARAINDDQLDAFNHQLAALMTSPGLDDATLRRAMNAGYRIGTVPQAAAIARLAADSRVPADLRLVAASLLTSWNTPQPTDTVTGRWRPLPQREVSGLDEAIRPALPGILAGTAELRERGIQLAADLGIQDIVPTLQGLLNDSANESATRVAAFRALVRLTRDPDAMIATALEDPSEPVRLAAVEAATRRAPQHAVPRLRELLDSKSVAACQTALRLLGPIRTRESEQALLATFARVADGSFPRGAVLDLIMAAELRGTAELKQAVESYRASQSQAGIIVDGWLECSEGGDADRGREIFFGRGTASCRRCHKVNGSGSDVGPDLSRIGRDKDRRYLLEAIVDPNAQIARGFESVVVVTADGLIHSGIIKSEDETVLRLMTPTGTIESIAVEDIDDRSKGVSGMPQDMTKNLTRFEVRDLVEYLTTLQSDPEDAHGY
jgi:quinoprotein glucose dehydrogenase